MSQDRDTVENDYPEELNKILKDFISIPLNFLSF